MPEPPTIPDPGLQQVSPDAMQAWRESTDASRRLVGQVEGATGRNKAAYDQYRADILKPTSALSSIHATPPPAEPQQQKLPAAPDAREYQKGAMEFASAMAVLGAIAGRFTRTPGAAALSAFAGALNGWKTGNQQAYENESKRWEQSTKATIENNRQVLEQYRLALADRKMNIDEQMSQIKLIATQYHDQIMYDAAATQNYTLVAQIYEKQAEFTQKVADSASKLKEKRDQQQQKNEQTAAYWLSPAGQQQLATLPEPQQAAVRQMIEIYASKSKKPTPQQAALDRFLEEHPQATAEEIQAFNARSLQPRSAPGMALRKFLDEHPNATTEDIIEFQKKQAGQTAYGRTSGTMSARVENASNEVVQLIPQALETSRALPRGKWVPFNELMQSWERGTSDERYNDFVLANFSLINAYTRAMNPQGIPRITERLEQKAMGILSTATSQKAYEVQVSRLWKEVQASKTATHQTMEGASPGDINAPVPGLTPPKAAPAAPAPEGEWKVERVQ